MGSTMQKSLFQSKKSSNVSSNIAILPKHSVSQPHLQEKPIMSSIPLGKPGTAVTGMSSDDGHKISEVWLESQFGQMFK